MHIRTGVVLSLDGGALQKQLPVFRFGLGGQAGSGQQWLSWITLADEIGAIRFLLDRERLSWSSEPDLADAMYERRIHQGARPGGASPGPVADPRLVTRMPLGVGDLAESLLFSSARVLPAALLDAGYSFEYADIDQALGALLGKGSAVA